ncbi:MAG: response regulator [Halobacteriaceae archaeon]
MEQLSSPPADTAPVDEDILVLHVDDDESFADLATTFLEREADTFETVTATSVDDGLDVIERRDVDCVVSDYEMPRADGIDFLDTVRGSWPDLPFILFTGAGSEAIAGRAISRGVTDYIQKGGREQYTLLANRIENAVAAHRAQRRVYDAHLAIETAREGIAILNDDGEFTYVNREYADLYGYDPGELVGEHWETLYREEDVAEVHEEILPTVEEQGIWRGETVGERADGETFVEDHSLATTKHGGLVCVVRPARESPNM